jgi:hypothetical protein
MRPGVGVARQIALQALVGGTDGFIRMQIDLLVCDTFPQPLDKHVIPPAAFPLPADLDPVGFQSSRELLAGELAALLGVEDLWRALIGSGVLDSLQAEVGRPCIGQPPRQPPTPRPVENRTQVHEAPCHRKGGDLGGPDVLGTRARQVAQEIGRDRVGGMPVAEVRLAIPRRKAHASHQRGHVPPPNRMAGSPHALTQHPGAGNRILQLKLGNPAHQGPLRLRSRRRLIVRGCPCARQELTLPNDWQGVGSGNHRVALSHPALMSAPSQQSCSSASCPIVAGRVLSSGVSAVGFAPPNTSAARASKGGFPSVLRVGWMRTCAANAASVLSPFMAANATCALEAAP